MIAHLPVHLEEVHVGGAEEVAGQAEHASSLEPSERETHEMPMFSRPNTTKRGERKLTTETWTEFLDDLLFRISRKLKIT